MGGIQKDKKITKQVKTEKKLYDGDKVKMAKSEGATGAKPAAAAAAKPAAAAAAKLNAAPAAKPALAQKAHTV